MCYAILQFCVSKHVEQPMVPIGSCMGTPVIHSWGSGYNLDCFHKLVVLLIIVFSVAQPAVVVTRVISVMDMVLATQILFLWWMLHKFINAFPWISGLIISCN